jgi:hypothetical protein
VEFRQQHFASSLVKRFSSHNFLALAVRSPTWRTAPGTDVRSQEQEEEERQRIGKRNADEKVHLSL